MWCEKRSFEIATALSLFKSFSVRDARRRHDRVAHTVQKFLVGWDNCSERAAELHLVLFDEVVGTKPHAPAHRRQLARLSIVVRMLDQTRLVEALHDSRGIFEIGE